MMLESKTIAMQSLGEQVLAATNMHTTIQKLLEMVFSMQSMLKLYIVKEQFPRVKSGERKLWVTGPGGSKTNNDCAGKGQQQTTGQTRTKVSQAEINSKL
jgi:hypothetical protein